MKICFPFEKIREIQSDIIQDLSKAMEKRKHFIMHAPTGLGKTAAALAPALSIAVERNLTVFFLTSRHTQHKIAIETLQAIKEKHDLKFSVVDLIGKKWMCPVPGTDDLYSSDFSEFCKAQREDDLCEFYLNTRDKNKNTPEAVRTLKDFNNRGPCQVEELVKICTENKLCPYEIAMMLASKATVIIGDYYHLFSPGVRETFLNKTEKVLNDSIIIVDEAHNLPNRVKDLATQKLSTFMIKNAISECEELNHKNAVQILTRMGGALAKYAKNLSLGGEILIRKQTFLDDVFFDHDIEQLTADLSFIADEVRKTKKQSFTGGIALFLEHWQGPNEGFVRILNKQRSRTHEPFISLSYRCLDPSVVTKDVIESSYSTILMSGTLKPTSMFADLLGFPDNTIEKSYSSPFDKKNKLSLIVPETTTKYSRRGPEESKRIAKVLCKILDVVPGNTAIFFPSYFLRDDIYKEMMYETKKTILLEESGLTKVQKEDLLKKFKSYSLTGAVLLAVSSGSFGEGIDLPGHFLQTVIVVGLPLQRPDLETKAIIQYYNTKFGKGWEYGYIFPALNIVFQNEGRLIRNETDKGAVIFLDERYAMEPYINAFSDNVKLTKLYTGRLEEFFH